MKMWNGECGMGNGLRHRDSSRFAFHSEFRIPNSEFSRRGQMLIVVLWVMGLVSVAVGSLAVQTTHALRIGRIPLESVQREALAQAAIYQAIHVLQQDTEQSPQLDSLNDVWATGRDASDRPVFESIPIGDGQFSIGHDEDGHLAAGLIDEERKLNLNTASADALAQLISLTGVMGTMAPQAIADAIVDWRDEPVGIACQGQSLPCHNAPLQTVDELRLVPGMTPELFDALHPYVTVYGSGAVNVNTAPAIVLDAMRCPGAALVEQRATPFTSPPPTCPASTVTSTAFTVAVEAWLSQSTVRAHRHAVVHRTGTILAWEPL